MKKYVYVTFITLSLVCLFHQQLQQAKEESERIQSQYEEMQKLREKEPDSLKDQLAEEVQRKEELEKELTSAEAALRKIEQILGISRNPEIAKSVRALQEFFEFQIKLAEGQESVANPEYLRRLEKLELAPRREVDGPVDQSAFK